MELRHYKEALECLDECETLAENKVADVFFRRSQIRTYNKLASDNDLQLALSDIKKAIELKNDVKIYLEHLDILNKIIDKKKSTRKEKVKSNYIFNRIT